MPDRFAKQSRRTHRCDAHCNKGRTSDLAWRAQSSCCSTWLLLRGIPDWAVAVLLNDLRFMLLGPASRPGEETIVCWIECVPLARDLLPLSCQAVSGAMQGAEVRQLRWSQTWDKTVRRRDKRLVSDGVRPRRCLCLGSNSLRVPAWGLAEYFREGL